MRRQDITEVLQALDEAVDNRIPTIFDWSHASDTPGDWEEVYGPYPTWDVALLDAGVITKAEFDRHGHYDTTDAVYDITDTVQDCIVMREGAPRNPTLYEVVEYTRTPADVFAEKFGSWSSALDAAYGDRENPECRQIPDEELLRELRRLKGKLGRPPTQEDYEVYGMYSLTPIRNAFGGIKNAREQASVGHPSGDTNREELLADLTRVARELGTKSPTTEMVDEHGEYAHSTYHRYWDSWDDVLEAADGLEPRGPRKLDRATLIRDLQQVVEEIGGRKPKVEDIREHGEYSYTAYLNHFGGIDQARKTLDQVV